jgi:hypothetical protein
MGFFKQSKKPAAQAAAQAAEMKAEEEARQARIRQGQGIIDNSFSKFDDNYYGGYETAYKGYYNPQIEDQYSETADALTAALAGRGILESTVGAERFAKLAEKAADAKARVASEAVDARNSLRGKVEKTKTDLYSMNTSAADPSAIAARAAGEATALAAPQAYSELGQLFQAVLAPVAAYSSAASNSRGGLFGNSNPVPKGAGSSNYVGNK